MANGSRQAIVIGLGQFGLSLARALAERGVEVLAVDRREDRVRALSGVVAEAACFDATDEAALAKSAPSRREVCICAIGDDAREASIICTALLRQMGAPRVIARANDDVHARILSLVGAHLVLNPERQFGERFASQVVHQDIMGELPLGDNLIVTEFHAPAAFIGHTLRELMLPKRFGIMVVAVRVQGGAVTLPDAELALGQDDTLVVVSNEGAVEKLMERV